MIETLKYIGSDALQRQLRELFHLRDSGLDQAFIDALFISQESQAEIVSYVQPSVLSKSTCPLYRGTLFTPTGFSMENPMYDFYDLREDDGCHGNGDNRFIPSQKTGEIEGIARSFTCETR
ncbi:unnamed protein product [Dovyalis caffra]|uniref:Uncharacterized protein n=1 Tax=Dovyalis caffra TaxID=77055 RepID=A0AAV1S9Q7_9ROSI|nr:unnamed protein product [Dovyalis caffra]